MKNRPVVITTNQELPFSVTDPLGHPIHSPLLVLSCSDPEIAEIVGGAIVPTGRKLGTVRVWARIQGTRSRKQFKITVVPALAPDIAAKGGK